MAKTLEEGFETFLGWLVPLNSEHDTAASHKSSVKSCLENNFGCYNFFETGSFGHGTGVRHYSDTDYFAVCKTANLKQNSATTLREVKTALQNTFWRTSGIEVKTPAVRIPFGKYKSEDLEVTPCDYQGLIETPLGKKATYDIPAYDGSWMRSSPDAHNAYVKKHDERLSGKLNNYFNKLWERLLREEVDKKEMEEAARRIQDEIYDNRIKSPLIPDRFYHLYRPKEETLMTKSANTLAAELIESRT